jgi:hypothetical protein
MRASSRIFVKVQGFNTTYFGCIVPLRNRVTPFGEIVIDPSRGSLMGNRGILHDDNQQLGTSRWKHKNWVTCTLSFKGTKRPLMAAGNYTELFFLDEVTALSAGHRPCAECRRPDFERFMKAWTEGNQLSDRPRALMVDAELHAHRVTRTGQRVTYRERADGLPDGTMAVLDGEAWLIWQGLLHRWSFTGYRDHQPLDGIEVEVLTPRPTVGALRGGYVPTVHESADRS